MKKNLITVFILLFRLSCFAQDWTTDQLNKANTAAEVAELSEDEKSAIMYINLARLFPKDFIQIELADDAELTTAYPVYTASLISDLTKSEPSEALKFDLTLYDAARCFAKESGDRGTVGHIHKNCKKIYNAECCSYGETAGWDIALQWLIDNNVPGLGHRINCLNRIYTKIGLSIHPHKKYRICAVADLGL